MASAIVLDCGHARVARCRHGWLLYNPNDAYVGRSLEWYGEYSEGEIDLLRHVLRPGCVVVEAGANIGAHTVPLANLVAPGIVHAFEPQRLTFQALCANAAINGLLNVHCRRAALGEAAGTLRVPDLDPRVVYNFGAVSLGGVEAGEAVPVDTVDGLKLSRCDLLKADVEGMELAVLKGAADTIERLRPVLYLENDKPERSADLIRHVLGLDYNLYWHLPPYYSANNFRADRVNRFPGTISINLLGVHRSVAIQVAGLRPVRGPESDWRGA